MPHTPRSILLVVCLTLLFLPPAHSKDESTPRAKSLGPVVLAPPLDPASLTPEQRQKQERGAAERAQRELRARFASTPPGTGIRPPLLVLSAAERAELEARLQAKIETVRAHQEAVGSGRGAAAFGPVRTKTAPTPSIVVAGPPGMTAAERAKLEAERAATASRKEAGR